MTTRSRTYRFALRAVITVSVLLVVAGALLALSEVKSRQQNESARAAADYATSIYQIQLSLGMPRAGVQTELAISNRSTIARGDEILIVAQEGRPPWYCRRAFFGTALHFDGGKLSQIRSDEWLEACL